MLRDKVMKYNREMDRNCAESILLAANEQYELGLNNEDIKLVSAFGGGMGCGSTCGALAGAMAALGKIMVEDCAHATVGFKDHCASLVKEFEETLGDIDCRNLIGKYRTVDTGCLTTIELAADVLEAHISKLGE